MNAETADFFLPLSAKISVYLRPDSLTRIHVNNEKRMDYARFRQQGYLIGSGTIESACKQIAAARLKCSGARWTLAGVIATAKARAAWLTKTWDNLKPLYFNLSLAL